MGANLIVTGFMRQCGLETRMIHFVLGQWIY